MLETLLNTNATHLNQDRAKSLIESGLDVICSFDGGLKKPEKNRPGRFSSNKFEDVVRCIQMFSKSTYFFRAASPLQNPDDTYYRYFP